MDIKSVMRSKGLTIAEVAHRMGIHRVSLSATLAKGNLQLSTMREIAQAIGCSVIDFFSDEMPSQEPMRHTGSSQFIAFVRDSSGAIYSSSSLSELLSLTQYLIAKENANSQSEG
ncbi:MAG: helix-turn-helix transcriptional regulator [Bacteroidales bacterium]|nr:helix-turn-helix transcriptional regulator [Bacteroidales bacterium]